MNIAIVTHSYPTKNDPSQWIFVQKEAHLIADFADVEIYVPSVYATPFNKQYYRNSEPVQEPFPVKTFTYFSIPRRNFPQLTGRFLSKKLLKNLRINPAKIIHLHALFPSGIAVPALKRKGYKTVITIHGGDWYSNINDKKMMALFRQSFRSADAIITVGKKLKKDVLTLFPKISDKTFHIPHGIDTKIFSPPTNIKEAKNKLQWKPNTIHLLCVGNLFKVKGIDVLVKAYAKLNITPKTHLHIIAPRHHKEAKREVEDYIEKANLQEQITFYPSMPAEKLAGFYKAADLFISPSRKEGFGLAVAEAAACGTPVVATKSGGPEEIITPKLGLFAEPNNVDSLKDAMEQAIESLGDFGPQQMNRLIQEKFGLEEKKQRLKSVYSDL